MSEEQDWKIDATSPITITLSRFQIAMDWRQEVSVPFEDIRSRECANSIVDRGSAMSRV
jgi:hypothetical protein